jgi:hypothetical protein
MAVYLACSSTDEQHTEWRVFVFAEGAISDVCSGA